MLERFGIKDVPSFQNPTNTVSRVLLLDGDGSCYKAAATVKKLDTAMRRLEQSILEYMFLAKCSTARVHITPDGCLKAGRGNLKGVKPYQGNRKGKEKPPLLELIRNSAAAYFDNHKEITIIENKAIEADDGLMIDHYRMRNGVLVSEDKDLLMSPYESWCVNTGKFLTLGKGDTFGYLTKTYTPSGTMKLKGKGTKFFWAQMLMGDTADNVQGLVSLYGKKCGGVAAFNLLDELSTESDAANAVLDAYRFIGQNPVPEAYALWLLRSEDDTAMQYISSLNLSDENRKFLEECYYRKDWYHDDAE